jgi:hypothetical protein
MQHPASSMVRLASSDDMQRLISMTSGGDSSSSSSSKLLVAGTNSSSSSKSSLLTAGMNTRSRGRLLLGGKQGWDQLIGSSSVRASRGGGERCFGGGSSSAGAGAGGSGDSGGVGCSLPLVDDMIAAALPQLRDFQPQDIANLLWAMEKLGHTAGMQQLLEAQPAIVEANR